MTAAVENEVSEQPPGHTARAVRGRRWAVLVPAAAMLVMGLWGLDRGSVWQDESATLEVARRSTGQIVAMLHNVDVVHGAYYLFMHVWLLPGGGEVWMRVPSVFATAVSAGAVAALGVRLSGTRVGLVAGGLFVASPLVSFYAQEGRSYALVTAFVLVATYALVRALQSGTRAWWTAYGGCMVAAVVLHEFAVLALAAHGTTLLLSRVRWAAWRRWLVVAAVCAVVVSPVAWLSQRQSGQVDWLTRPTWGALADLAEQLLGASPWLLLATGVLTLVGIGAVFRTRRRTAPGLGSVALPLLVPLVLLIAVSEVVEPLFHIRYVLFAAAAVPLLAARGVELVATSLARAGGRTWVGWLVAAAVVAAALVAQLPAQRQERTVESRANDLAAAAAVVSRQAQPGDAVVFMPLRYRAAALAYPDAFVHVVDVALARTPIQAANLRGIDGTRSAVATAMLARPRIWVLGRTNLDVRVNEPGALNEQAVLREHFTKVRATDVWGMQVALYVRR